MKGSFIQDFRGKNIGGVVFLTDITNIKALEEKITYLNHEISLTKESETKYRFLIEGTDDGYFIIQNEKFIFANKAISDISGYNHSEILGEKFINFIAPEFKNIVFRNYQKLIAGKELHNRYKFKIIHKYGHKIDVEAKIHIGTHEKEPIIAGTIKDITKQKREEDERRKLEERIIQMQKMESLGALAGGIAHDFNNLLGGILGYASLLMTKIPKDTSYYHDVENILSIANRASDLTSKILAYARREKYNVRIVNINNIVNEVVSLLSRTIERKISIEKYLEENLSSFVMADENQIQQAFLNVCINARDAMPDGGILTIRTENVSLKESFIENYIGIGSGDYILITISDTGIGMDEKVRKRIFEPFFTTKQKTHGTGLGLSIVYEIIKGHDGYITVESKLGKGTTFRIYLPAVKSQILETVSIEEKELPMGNETVLIVDDEEIIRNLTREILERFGYKVFTASNGEEAIETYIKMNDRIDIIVLDMIMPGIGGKRTFSKLKEINSKANILLMSGYKKNGEAQETLNGGASGFLQKPFNVKDLIKTINMILNKEKMECEVS